jgi:hypothetical protein
MPNLPHSKIIDTGYGDDGYAINYVKGPQSGGKTRLGLLCLESEGSYGGTIFDNNGTYFKFYGTNLYVWNNK